MLPNFLVIGAMKSGTTSLAHYLRAHPEVYVPDKKELYFFTAEDNWDRGIDWYEAQFRAAGDARAVGEASVGYSMHPRFDGVPERIAKVLPEVRLIYLVREPVERMISQYRHHAWHGWEVLPIDRALRENPVYLDTSRYAMQIERYLDHFGRDAFMVIRTEQLKSDRAATLRTVFDFLGVESRSEIDNVDREFHTSAGKRRVRPIAGSVQSNTVYRTVSRFIPLRVRRSLYRLGTEWISEQPGISVGLRAHLHDRLRPDVLRLMEYANDPGFDGWGIP